METASHELETHPVGADAIHSEIKTTLGYLAIESEALKDTDQKRDRHAILVRCDSHLDYYSALRGAL